MEQSSEEYTTFACNMSAFTEKEREQHIQTIKEVFGSVTKIDEMKDGYEFCLPAGRISLQKSAEFIAGERLCCPFFTFEMKTGPGNELWLSLKGADGIKPFIEAEIGQFLKDSVACEASFKKN